MLARRAAIDPDDPYVQKAYDVGLVAALEAAEKQAGGSGWETIKWKQRLYEDMCIEIARANYAMLKERTLPPRVA